MTAYVKQTWIDGASGGTPLSADRLSHIEDGVAAALVATDLVAERAKLATIAPNATVNSTDAQLRDRTTHTGLQPATSISGLSAVATTGAYSDLTGKPTVPAAYTDEQARDAVGAALVGGTNVVVTVNDALDTIVLATTATVNSTDAQLRDRSTHTGVEPISALPAGSTLTVIKPTGGSWPVRPTSRTDVIVAWKGADPSPSIVASGTGGMIDGVDFRLVTP